MIDLEGSVDPIIIHPEFQHKFYKHPRSEEKHWLHEEGSIFTEDMETHDTERIYSEELEGDWNIRTEFTIYKQKWPEENYFGEVTGSIIDIWIGVADLDTLKRRAHELDYTQIID